MKPSHEDVAEMVSALFTLKAGLDRAQRQNSGAARLALLQVIGEHPGLRPSEIADRLQVDFSLVSRQVQSLEHAGYVAVVPDSSDRRSRRVSLTSAGSEEWHRLHQYGLARFETFVADWDTADVVTLARLLRRLYADASKAPVAEQETRGR